MDRKAPDLTTGLSLAELAVESVPLIDRLLHVVEDEIVPLTRVGVNQGNKLFGGAVLRMSDQSTVVAVTNAETENPLMHGEITAIHAFYQLRKEKRPAAKDCLFVSTHEPCPLCLAAIAWAGFGHFFYLFSYQDSKDAFGIPHDLRMHEEIFRLKDGAYARQNHYWNAWSIQDLISDCDSADRQIFEQRVSSLYETYGELSQIYQQSKNAGAEIPLN